MTTAHHLTVSRTARYFTLGDRTGADQVWFVLHGYSQLAQGFLTWFEAAKRPGRLIVAPEALSRAYFEENGARRVGASWMTKEDRAHEIQDYVHYLDLLADELISGLPPRPRIEIHGFSQGAATACRWAALGKIRPDRVVLWGGLVPPDLPLDRFQARIGAEPLRIVVGSRDAFVPREQFEAEERRLHEAGIPTLVQTFEGGHRVDAGVLSQIAS